jgi:hypothetical protein
MTWGGLSALMYIIFARMFHGKIRPAFGDTTSLMLLPALLYILEKIANFGHSKVSRSMMWPISEENRRRSADETGRQSLDVMGDWQAVYSIACAQQTCVPDTFRMAILVVAAIESPNDFQGPLTSVMLTFMQMTLVRTEWGLRSIVGIVHTLTGKIPIPLVPSSFSRNQLAVKKTMNYPKYPCYIAIFIARLGLVDGVAKASFCEDGYAVPVVIVACLVCDILVDSVVELCEKRGWMAKWTLCQHIYDKESPTHWRRTDGPIMRFQQMHRGMAMFAVGTVFIWTIAGLYNYFGWAFVVGCTEEMGLKKHIHVQWPSAGCAQW